MQKPGHVLFLAPNTFIDRGIKERLINKLSLVFVIITVIFASPLARANKPAGSIYIEGASNEFALILLHGRGKHPAWKVVNPLRKGVHRKLGYHTLSLQMPGEKKSWREYARDFPEAYKIIRQGINYLRKEKRVTKIFLMGHSMGSRMASAFISANPTEPLSGLIVAGCRNNGDFPLACDKNLANVDIPVLDIWGGDDSRDTTAASERAALVSTKYVQVSIPGANHKFDGHNDELVSTVVKWLATR